MSEWTKEERNAAQQKLLSNSALVDVVPGLPHWHRNSVIELQCERDALRKALEYMYDSARELSCECFELGALAQAKELLTRIPK